MTLRQFYELSEVIIEVTNQVRVKIFAEKVCTAVRAANNACLVVAYCLLRCTEIVHSSRRMLAYDSQTDLILVSGPA
jgi:hypothetical protein